jgi:hypothetical protein
VFHFRVQFHEDQILARVFLKLGLRKHFPNRMHQPHQSEPVIEQHELIIGFGFLLSLFVICNQPGLPWFDLVVWFDSVGLFESRAVAVWTLSQPSPNLPASRKRGGHHRSPRRKGNRQTLTHSTSGRFACFASSQLRQTRSGRLLKYGRVARRGRRADGKGGGAHPRSGL